MTNKLLTIFLALVLAIVLAPSYTVATEHGNPDGSCDLVCEAEVEGEGLNQAFKNDEVIFNLAVQESKNQFTQMFCVWKEGLSIFP